MPEAVPLGMDASPYPDRIEPRPNLSEADAKAPCQNAPDQPLQPAPRLAGPGPRATDAAVAAAYGWQDWRADMPGRRNPAPPAGAEPRAQPHRRRPMSRPRPATPAEIGDGQ